jgi:hypothetical protein
MRWGLLVRLVVVGADEHRVLGQMEEGRIEDRAEPAPSPGDPCPLVRPPSAPSGAASLGALWCGLPRRPRGRVPPPGAPAGPARATRARARQASRPPAPAGPPRTRMTQFLPTCERSPTTARSTMESSTVQPWLMMASRTWGGVGF